MPVGTLFNATPERHQLSVDVDRLIAVLDGASYTLQSKTQAQVLSRFLELEGEPVTEEEMKAHAGSSERPFRTLGTLPGPIRDLFRTKRGVGTRLSLDNAARHGQYWHPIKAT